MSFALLIKVSSTLLSIKFNYSFVFMGAGVVGVCPGVLKMDFSFDPKDTPERGEVDRRSYASQKGLISRLYKANYRGAK